jgi:hypothetical protein
MKVRPIKESEMNKLTGKQRIASENPVPNSTLYSAAERAVDTTKMAYNP